MIKVTMENVPDLRK